MPPEPQLETKRLLLRRWDERDRAPFAALNADAEVMHYFPALRTSAESDESINAMERHFDKHGFGFWALEERETGRFLGFTGLIHVPYQAHFTPAVEIGWRLVRSAWGCGLATEAAHAALEFGYAHLDLDEIVSVTAAGNERSRAVMRRIGMTRDPADDFTHPHLDPDHRLQPCVLYRRARPA
ncbi:GNAT family N-acetyltransferase [Lipingzhangella sp. LS1_29]|uniref:GNAT family N-acetyltransferase n=1 Tax=Lipingzhangella rawalii TaxID=2055835 RepID=A0ABU2H111_9ACTN|nr:GNAT family N-acetyltransferase [Lipingzhangella rawalii]MDS1268987.1 GNAT family N-acetyltransferase [Lipingzhangella rawalii]